MTEAAADPAGGTVFFDALLHPNTSLSRPGFRVLMGGLALVSAVVGMAFVARGAWPVFGFYGLDLLLLYLALKINYRRARMYEKVRLTASALTVERGDGSGRRWVATLPSGWLRVTLAGAAEDGGQVVLSSHGRSIIVGAFLSPDERVDFAQALRQALELSRTAWAMREAEA